MIIKLKYLGIVLLFLSAQCKTISQNQPDFSDVDVFIPCKGCIDAQMDPLGNLYLLTSSNEIIKYSKSGKELYRYSNRFFGTPQALDVINPQKVLLFYRDFQTIILLDNTLSELDRIALEEWGFANLPAVAMSNDNQLWAFDDIESKLLKLNKLGEILLESDPLNLLLTRKFSPDDIFERNNTVILQDNQQGILLFDQFGQFIKDTGIRTQQKIECANDAIYFIENAKLHAFDLNTMFLATKPLDKKEVDIKRVLLEKDFIYFLTTNGLIRETVPGR